MEGLPTSCGIYEWRLKEHHVEVIKKIIRGVALNAVAVF